MPRKRTERNRLNERLWLELCPLGSFQRADSEAFIHDCFARTYGADIRDFLPRQFCLRDEGNRIQAALGYRLGEDGPLFLEHYLTAPVETVISQMAGVAVERSAIVEVGNLASRSAGGNRWLITALTSFLRGEGAHWVVFTTTPALLNSFARMGLHPIALASARIECLPPTVTDWGRYYDTKPVVVAGNVDRAFNLLQKKLEQEQALTMYQSLWLQSYATGLQQSALA